MAMIRILEGFADNVIAASAIGRVTREDYEAVLIPRVGTIAKKHPKIRCYYEIGTDFAGMEPGAVWEDFRVGVEYWMRWERVAVVTDVAWITHVVNAFRFLMPGHLRVFPTGEKETARSWIEAP
jgi:SpoIIAA-like